jgi:acyl-CoA thioesterase-2
MSELTAADKAIGSLLRRLDVQSDGVDAYVGEASHSGMPRLFGGLVAGQATVACARTVGHDMGSAPALRGGASGMHLHSLHAYFLQPGDPAQPVHYQVLRLKEGKNFHARQVIARQGERVIYSMQASFQRAAPGFSHQDPMPPAPMPESLPVRDWGFWGSTSPVQMRECDGSLDEAAERGMRRVWLRPAAALPEDPVLHLGVLVFASDMTFVMTGTLPHPELRKRPRGGASLDHAMWFHHVMPFDDWTLYTMQTPAANAARPLITGAMYRRDGTRIASVAQEGLIMERPRTPRA